MGNVHAPNIVIGIAVEERDTPVYNIPAEVCIHFQKSASPTGTN